MSALILLLIIGVPAVVTWLVIRHDQREVDRVHVENMASRYGIEPIEGESTDALYERCREYQSAVIRARIEQERAGK